VGRAASHDKQSGVPGVTWIKQEEKWGVWFTKYGRNIRLMAFAFSQLNIAIDMRKEAEALPEDRIDERLTQMKEKYRRIRDMVAGGFEYKSNKDLPDLPDGPAGEQTESPARTLAQLLHKAQTADRKVERQKQVVEDAQRTHKQAISEAKAAWDAYAQELLANNESAGFLQSKLGKLLGGG
jgi:DNA repair exonuclease SbcCD ATPase subunit